MYPILIEFGFLKIFTYGLLVATGFLVAIMFASSRAEKEGLDSQKVLDLCFYIMVSALLGARLLYVVVEYKYFWAYPLEIFKFWKGGLVFYGGLILGVLVSLWYLNRHHMPVWKTADLLVPSIAIGQAIGRWGCLFAGCCYGKETDAIFGITFTNPRSLAPLETSLHPTQIYLSINALFIFIFLPSVYLIFRLSSRFNSNVSLGILIISSLIFYSYWNIDIYLIWLLNIIYFRP